MPAEAPAQLLGGRYDRGPQSATRRSGSFARVAEALAFEHDPNVIHCDVSPGNVLIRRSDGPPQALDFGLACRAGVNAPRSGADAAVDARLHGA